MAKGIDWKFITKILSQKALKFDKEKVEKLVENAIKGDTSNDELIGSLITGGLSIAEQGFKGNFGSKHFAESIVKAALGDRLKKEFRNEKEREWMLKNLSDKELEKVIRAGSNLKEEIKSTKGNISKLKDSLDSLGSLKGKPPKIDTKSKFNEEKALKELDNIITKDYKKNYAKIKKVQEKLIEDVEYFKTNRWATITEKGVDDETTTKIVQTKTNAWRLNTQKFPNEKEFAELSREDKMKILDKIKDSYENNFKTVARQKKYVRKNIIVNASPSKAFFQTEATKEQGKFRRLDISEGTLDEDSGIFTGFESRAALERAEKYFNENFKLTKKDYKDLDPTLDKNIINKNFVDMKENAFVFKETDYTKPKQKEQFNSNLVTKLINSENREGTKKKLQSLLTAQKDEENRLRQNIQSKQMLSQIKSDKIKQKELKQKLQSEKDTLKRQRELKSGAVQFKKDLKTRNKVRENKIKRNSTIYGMLTPKGTSPEKIVNSINRAVGSGIKRKNTTKAKKASQAKKAKRGK